MSLSRLKESKWTLALGACASAIILLFVFQVGRADPLTVAGLLKEGRDAATRGEHIEAIRLLSKAINSQPESIDLYEERAKSYVELGQWGDALGDIEDAVRLDPEDLSIYVKRAHVYRKFGRVEFAIRDLNTALERDSSFVDAYFNRGLIFYELGDFAKSLFDFQMCTELRPEAGAPYFNLAMTFDALGDRMAAEKTLQKFIEIEKNPSWRNQAQTTLEEWRAIPDKFDDTATR